MLEPGHVDEPLVGQLQLGDDGEGEEGERHEGVVDGGAEGAGRLVRSPLGAIDLFHRGVRHEAGDGERHLGEHLRAERDDDEVRRTLDALTRSAEQGSRHGSLEGNLLALAVDAARARATLGEISSAMEESFKRYGTVPTPVKGVYAAPYKGDPRWEQVVDGVRAVERRMGRKPKLLVAKMGQDGHDRGANVIASAFGDMGFDVVSGPLFQTPEETVVLALETGVDVVGASSLAAGHKTLIPELINRLRAEGRSDIKVIAGGAIPPQDYDFLRDAGVQGIYGPGTNVVECAADVLRLLGHNMPPAGLAEAAE